MGSPLRACVAVATTVGATETMGDLVMKCAPKVGQKRAGANGELMAAAHAIWLQTQLG